QNRLFDKSKSSENILWFKHEGETKRNVPGEEDDSVMKLGNSLWFPKIAERHSGNYSCWNGERTIHFLVDLMQRNEMGCRDYGDSEVTLVLGEGGNITCPGVTCNTSTQNSAIRWYKNDKSAGELMSFRDLTLRATQIILHTVYEKDSANFTCDHDHVDGITWTVRRTVRVTVIPPANVNLPYIISPKNNQTEEVDLGKPHTLTCKVQSAVERNFNLSITWLVNYHDNQGLQLLEMDSPQQVERSIWEQTINQNAQIQQVTQKHLGATFICWAQNSKGNASVTVSLRRRPEAARLILVITGPIVMMLVITGFSVLVRLYWLEIYLLYRTYLPLTETTTVGKEYDAFVSCVSTSSSEEEDSTLTGEELGLHHLPKVLEQQCGYRLCLLQRDLVPGGAYTEDVLWSIQRSRRVICVLSACYLRSESLFELETSLKALREDRQLRLILIWGTSPPARLDSLPPTVRRALRVLPAIRWSSSEAARSDSRFWKSLKMAMPVFPLQPHSVRTESCLGGGESPASRLDIS
ncbi:interleukin-18 receptor accessory protein-like, partial [Megalops cyprinoides]|uniref:interleukin-18 receptor accessory protein-like n=1 Tax=Megalops cyprinoides TaxID=118141 RepID=UPI001864EB9F